MMVLGAGGAVAFAGVLIAQAGELVASTDAIAVAGFGGRLDGDERHNRGIVRFLLRTCKREQRAPKLRSDSAGRARQRRIQADRARQRSAQEAGHSPSTEKKDLS